MKHLKVEWTPLTSLLTLLCFILAFLAFAFYESNKHAWRNENAYLGAFKCPAQYATSDERTAGLQKFSNMFGALNPKATLNDFVVARIDFYIAYGCTDELTKYGYDGTSPITPDVRRKVIEGMYTFLTSGKGSSQ